MPLVLMPVLLFTQVSTCFEPAECRIAPAEIIRGRDRRQDWRCLRPPAGQRQQTTADSQGRLWLMWTRDVGGPVEGFAARSDAGPESMHVPDASTMRPKSPSPTRSQREFCLSRTRGTGF